MIYVSVVSHESVGAVAFSLWAAFEEPHCRDRDCGSGSFGLPGNSIGVVDPVPNVSCQTDLMNIVTVKGLTDTPQRRTLAM